MPEDVEPRAWLSGKLGQLSPCAWWGACGTERRPGRKLGPWAISISAGRLRSHCALLLVGAGRLGLLW